MRRGFLDFTVELVSDEISFEISGTKIQIKDKEPISGQGRFGVSSWGGNVTLDGLSFENEGQNYPLIQIDHSDSELIKNRQKN